MMAGRMASVVAAGPIGITTHDADGNCRCQPRCCRMATVVTRMMMAGESGGKVRAMRLQGNNEATRMQRQSAMAPARARLIELVV